jgi:hypothetical protein
MQKVFDFIALVTIMPIFWAVPTFASLSCFVLYGFALLSMAPLFVLAGKVVTGLALAAVFLLLHKYDNSCFLANQ